ncbi:MAG: lyase family protein [Magnetovibrionaceae bacterium]
MSDHYGVGGSLKAEPAQILVDSAYAQDSAQAPLLMPGLARANLAHFLMLCEQDIVPRDIAGKVLPQLIALCQNDKASEVVSDPRHGDAYNSMDAFLKSRLGQTAGWLHAGRARREAVNIAFLLAAKQRYLACEGAMLGTAEALLRIAKNQRSAIMPDWTYYLHAQPTTLGHYLLTFLESLVRDLDRWEQGLTVLDSCPGGAGSVNGSRLPLDRQRLADLLGFSSVAVHTRDAMWKPDVPMQIAANLAQAMANLSRLCEELMIWNTAEFGFVDLPDRFCRASVIMPQKKNPYALAYFRGLATSQMGLMSQYGGLGKGPSGFPDSRVFVYGSLLTELENSTKAMSLLGGLLSELTFHPDKMAKAAREGYTFSTDLADHLLLRCRCDYQTAHNIVGAFVRELAQTEEALSEKAFARLRTIAQERDVDISALDTDELLKLCAPDEVILTRKTLGGAGPEPLDAMLNRLDSVIDQHNQRSVEARRHHENTAERLVAESQKFLAEMG